MRKGSNELKLNLQGDYYPRECNKSKCCVSAVPLVSLSGPEGICERSGDARPFARFSIRCAKRSLTASWRKGRGRGGVNYCKFDTAVRE